MDRDHRAATRRVIDRDRAAGALENGPGDRQAKAAAARITSCIVAPEPIEGVQQAVGSKSRSVVTDATAYVASSRMP